MAKISYEESIKILQAIQTQTIIEEKVFLSDTLGRILSRDIIAKQSLPIAPTSAMDGYAVIHSDLEKGIIKIKGDNPAGGDNSLVVSNNFCVKTFTGSLMPKGADTLIPIENVSVKDDHIIINKTVNFGFSVRPIAESYTKGDILLKKGTFIDYAEIGVMAGLNIVNPYVVKKPTVAVLSTGSEILDIGEEQTRASQIRSSNHYTLEALAKKHGANVVQLGLCQDDKTSITNAMKMGLASANILVTTGGVSVGDYDFVKDVVKEHLGAKVLFQGVNIKPGQHIMLAQVGDKFIVALPGFAFSSTVTFILYVIPLIQKLLQQNKKLEIIDAILLENFNKRSKKSEFAPCNLSLINGQYYVDFKGKKTGTSAILTNMLDNTALIVTSPDEQSKEKNNTIRVLKGF